MYDLHNKINITQTLEHKFQQFSFSTIEKKF